MKRLLIYLLVAIATVLCLCFVYLGSEVANLGFSPLRQPGFFIPQILIIGMSLFFTLRNKTEKAFELGLAVVVFGFLLSTGFISALNQLIVLKSEDRITKVQSKSASHSWGSGRWRDHREIVYLLQVLTINGQLTNVRVDVSVWKLLQVGNEISVKSEIGLTHVEFIYHSSTIRNLFFY